MENSFIEWCRHTFNPWIGCTKVSPGCKYCYAEAMMDLRYGKAKWGKGNPRVRTSEDNWKLPMKWNREAAQAGDRPRVFCASLADWLDDEVPIKWLTDLLQLIAETPNLDWLLLTKRPENFESRITKAIVSSGQTYDGHAPDNVWIGISVEDQKRADERIPALLKIPAKVRFLSCEPLLGPVDLENYLWKETGDHIYPLKTTNRLHWVISGGESGSHARPMHPDWARSLRDQCAAARVPFFFKQWGEWAPECAQYPATEAEFSETERSGPCGDIALEPDGTIAEGYQPISKRTWIMNKTGKKSAGRLLDGREWNEFPESKIENRK